MGSWDMVWFDTLCFSPVRRQEAGSYCKTIKLMPYPQPTLAQKLSGSLCVSQV